MSSNAHNLPRINEASSSSFGRDNAQEQTTASSNLNPLMSSPITHHRMRLYDDENDWALDIKEAIERAPDIDNLSDYQYAQLAIVDQDDIESALDRARKMQVFKQEYDIREDFICGQRYMKEFIELLPGNWLFLSTSGDQCVLVADMSKLTLDKVRSSPRGVQIWLAGTYFMSHVLNADFYSTRHGFTVLADNEGYNWSKNFGFDLHRKLWSELASVYPLQISKIKNYNTNLVYNLVISMSRRFIREEVHSKIEVGCKCEMGRLENLYAVPNLQAANERLMIRFEEALQRRYENEANFKLRT